LRCLKTKTNLKNLNQTNTTMKKSIFTLAVLAAATIASAQDFKPAAGQKTLEFNFAPLGGSPLSISGIQFRSFSSEKSAIRANIFVGFSNHKEVTNPAITGPAGSNATETTTKTSSLEIGLTPGIEKHMEGTDRLSPYMGLLLDLGFKSYKKTEEARFANSTTGDQDSIVTTETKGGSNGWLRVGLLVPIGFDWYFTKKLYMGAEMGIGVGFTKGATEKITQDPAVTPAPTVKVDDQKGDTDINFGPTVNGKIRLGWVF
jgi:hypothetical protein